MARRRARKKVWPFTSGRSIDTAGLAAHYKLYAGFTTPVVAGVSDGSVFDYSLNGNVGVIDKDNAVTLPAYPGFSFDGADSLITVAADPSIDAFGKTALSISAWINPSSDGENDEGSIVSKINIPGYKFAVSGELGGFVSLGANLLMLGDNINTKKANVIPINQWSHVAIVWFEGGIKKGKLYHNGVLLTGLSSDSTGTGTPADDRAVDLIIGDQEDATRAFDGLIDDVMIYETSKSAAEIKSIFEQTRWRYGV